MDKKNHHMIEIPAEKPHHRKAFILMHLIDTALYKIELQKSRVEDNKKKITKIIVQDLFADIHFLLISFSNLNKLLKNLCICLKDDSALIFIFQKHKNALLLLNNFRDHLEHITEGRLEGRIGRGKKLIEPNILGNLSNDTYDFGGEKFNLKNAYNLAEEIKEDLNKWNTTANIYPIIGKP